MNAQNLATVEKTETQKSTAVAKPVDTVRAALEKMKPQMALALPKHITPERMLRVTMTAVQNTPKLLDCDRTSLFAAVMLCCQLGLEPDGVLGQAYLIPFGNKVQFIPGYKGLISLARNSGDVVSIEAHEVCEKDHFDFSFGLNGRLEHIPSRGDRGAITHFWALAKFKDGGYHYDVMTREEVDAIRNRSPGKNSDPWKIHYAEMGKKTAIRRIAKYLPMSVQKAAAIDAAYDGGKYSTVDSDGEIVIDQTPQIAAPTETVDPETGVITEVETAQKPADAAMDRFEQQVAGSK